MKESRWLTYAEVATLLGVSPRTVRRLVRAGKLPALSLNARVIRLSEIDVAAFVAAEASKHLAATRRNSSQLPVAGRVSEHEVLKNEPDSTPPEQKAATA